jgi:hypothetical protein
MMSQAVFLFRGRRRKNGKRLHRRWRRRLANATGLDAAAESWASYAPMKQSATVKLRVPRAREAGETPA